jgi:hypothetical protein
LSSLYAPEKTSRSVTHPEIAPGQARLTLEFFADGLPEKKLQLSGISMLLILLSRGGCYIRPHRQLARNFNQEVVGKVKEEVSRLLKAGFMQPCRCVEWVSNVVPVEKKSTGKIRVCVDFRDLNRATPKDE